MQNLSDGQKGFSCKPFVLTMRSLNFLGAFPGVAVTDPTAGVTDGLLEVKCTSQCKGDRSIRYLTPRQIVEKYGTELCLQILLKGALQLKRSHIYYTQVHGEVAVKGYSVVWTNARSANVFVE